MSRPARALCLLLLALALAATAVRGVRLARGEALTAHGERLWFGWAYRHPGLAAQLAQARAGLAAGETVWLAVAATPDQARWLRVMARYHLPEQEPGGVLEPGAAPPAAGTVVAVDLTGRGGSAPGAGGATAAGGRSQATAGGPPSETPAIGEAGAGWPREAAAVALGAALAVALGLAALRPGSAASALAAAPLAGTAGLALLTAALYPLWRLGVPAGPAPVLATAAVLAGALALLARRAGGGGAAGEAAGGGGESWLDDAASDDPGTEAAPGSAPGPAPAAGRRGWSTLVRAAPVWAPAAAALGVFLWKLTRVPLWSWDHYAIWGLKARRLFPGGVLDVGWLVPSEFARPDYPLGLPLAWRALTLGAEPGPAAFATAHALMAIALVALVGRAAWRLGGGALAGGAAAALAAASPLLWDTESLGLADLPLALWAVAAVAAVAPRLAPATGDGGIIRAAPASPLWIAGVCLGFLPWLKSEGLPLALLLLATSAVGLLVAAAAARGRSVAASGAAGHGAPARLGRLRALLAVTVPAVLLGAAGLAATPALGVREAGFFRDDWAGRGLARLGEAPRLLAAMAADLIEPGWLGVWPLWAAAAAALAVLLVRRRTGRAAAAGLALSAAVALQLGLYFATYLVTHLPPDQHVKTSFFRIAAALAPLALVAASALAAARGAGSAGSLSRAAAASPPAAAGRG